MTWHDAVAAELPDGTLRDAELDGRRVALARADGVWYAFDPWCTHAECPLTDGWLEGAAVRCACHATLFDLATGAPLEGPAVEPVEVFPTRVAGGRVEIGLPGA
jgi:3-phenylpropionate/trans-cinnamate dioxygenase ferredoxin subunit